MNQEEPTISEEDQVVEDPKEMTPRTKEFELRMKLIAEAVSSI
jgi:hypothetical protein